MPGRPLRPRSDRGRDKESGFFGVQKNTDGQRYAARFPPQENDNLLGVFNTAEAAAKEYDDAARRSAGKWPVNFPRDDEEDGTCAGQG